MRVHYNGQNLSKRDVIISPDDRGFLFADGVYEVIRSYGGSLFRYGEHLERLEIGLKELRIGGIELRGLQNIVRHLLKENDLERAETIVYVQITRGVNSPGTDGFPAGGNTTDFVCRGRSHFRHRCQSEKMA